MIKGRIIFLIVVMTALLNVKLMAGNTEEIETGNIEHIEIIGKINVKLIVSKEEKLELYYDGIDREKISIHNESGKLKIKIISTLSYKNADIQIKLFIDEVQEIAAYSGASIFSEETMVAGSLNIHAESGGEIQLKVFTDQIKSESITGGIVALSGNTVHHISRIASGSTLSAYELDCETYSILVHTKGKAKINAKKSIQGKVSSGGYIAYIGEPALIEVESTMGGKLEKIEMLE